MTELLQTLVGEQEIRKRVYELAEEVGKAYPGQELTLIGVLDDSFIFLSDLIRAVNRPLSCCFLKTSEHLVSGHKDIQYTTEFDPAGHNILLVLGVLDTGVTADYIVQHLLEKSAKSVRVVVLVDKPDVRRVEIKPDFVGFTRSEKMIVGYGLGFHDKYRYMPYLASLDEE